MKIAHLLLLGASCACALGGCAKKERHPEEHASADAHEHGEAAHEDDEVERGPHGGRMLVGEGLSLEMTIYEPGIPPQSRVYPYDGATPLAPRDIELSVDLVRFDRTPTLSYTPTADFLLGNEVVEEPHSFEVHVRATRAGKKFTWTYSSYEGRASISADAARSAGLVLEQAEPRTLRTSLRLFGRVRLNEEQLAHASPRYGGVVRELRRRVGDSVRQGDTLAMVESSETLQSFAVTAAVSGRILQRSKTVGEVVQAGEAIYVVAGLDSVWVDLAVHASDASRVAPGQKVLLVPEGGAPPASGVLSYVAPVATLDNQTVLARATVANAGGALRPGSFVSADVAVAQLQAEVAVRASAVQRFRDWEVVFRNKGDVYEVTPIELGVRDGDWVEVRAGLRAGESYVAQNAFVVKAEIGKAAASHDH